MEEKKFEIKIGDKDIIIKTTDWAQQASGACLVQCGGTEVLTTVVVSQSEKEGIDFFPLTVEYEERYYAAGKIFGSRFIRRETRPTDEAILTARMIDRAVRPLFPLNFRKEVQIITTCLSWDSENDPDVLGLIGASFVLSISDVPWNGPIGGLRIGKANGKWIFNPTYKEREECEFEITFSGIKKENKILVNMIEMGGKEIKEDEILTAIEVGDPEIRKMIDLIEEIKIKFGKPKEQVLSTKEVLDGNLKEWIKERAKELIENSVPAEKNLSGLELLKDDLLKYIEKNYPEASIKNEAFYFLETQVEKAITQNIIEKGKRPDGRAPNELREISCKAGVLPKTHGSGIFYRGLTRVLSILTLGGPSDQQLIEAMEFVGKKRFLHHYNFPPYCAGEVAPLRGPRRREIGHGNLAEKALLPVIPDFEKFPYTIRIVSEVLSSNGSTSMASVCSSTLALMDAGVPIKEPVAGISVGLVKDEEDNYKLLTDIQGPEDHFGDMDFKVAGTKNGITAIQMDVKIDGIDSLILKEALEKAREARLKILDIIKNEIPEPRKNLPAGAPKVFVFNIDPTKIGEVIGTKGSTINKIIDECDVSIDIEETGRVFVSGNNEEGVKKATEWIKSIAKEVVVGETFTGVVKKITNFGAFVEFLPGHSGMVHISKFVPHRINNISEVVKEGDKIPVKVIGIDEQGRINLSAIDAGFKPKTTLKKDSQKHPKQKSHFRK